MTQFTKDCIPITSQIIRYIKIVLKDGTSKGFIARKAGYCGRSNASQITKILNGNKTSIYKDRFAKLVVFLDYELNEIKKRNRNAHNRANNRYDKIYKEITPQMKEDIQAIIDSGVSQSFIGSQFGYYGSSGRTTVYDILKGTRKRIHKDNYDRLKVYLKKELNDKT